ncbi:MAG: putative HNHc nuclease [Thermincolia bacterium]
MQVKCVIDNTRTVKSGMKITLDLDEKETVDVIGMGRDRREYDDSKHEKIALCREHHTEAHTIGWKTFAGKYHVIGLVFNG